MRNIIEAQRPEKESLGGKGVVVGPRQVVVLAMPGHDDDDVCCWTRKTRGFDTT